MVDAEVTNVNKVSERACGMSSCPSEAILSLPPQMGFFASVGPLSIFTSTHLLPLEFRFQPDSNPPEFASPDGQVGPALVNMLRAHSHALPVLSHQNIVKGKKVRLRIVGTRVDASEIFAIGSCKEDYVGPFD